MRSFIRHLLTLIKRSRTKVQTLKDHCTSRHQDAVRVDSQSVDDGVVPRQVLDEVAVRKRPLFDVIGRARSKGVSIVNGDKVRLVS